LRELYRRGDLSPIAEITTRAVRPPAEVSEIPAARGGTQAELRRALATGRVRDPGAEKFRRRLRFDSRRISDPPRWMNGLIYNRRQLLAVPELRRRLATRRVVGPYDRRRVVLPPLDQYSRAPRERIASWIPILAALEARYLPTIDPEWLRLTNAEVSDWDELRINYDPTFMAQLLEVIPEEMLVFARVATPSRPHARSRR
jgi:hypothetical protein